MNSNSWIVQPIRKMHLLYFLDYTEFVLFDVLLVYLVFCLSIPSKFCTVCPFFRSVINWFYWQLMTCQNDPKESRLSKYIWRSKDTKHYQSNCHFDLIVKHTTLWRLNSNRRYSFPYCNFEELGNSLLVPLSLIWTL